MPSAEPDTWFRFVRAHRCLIREIERRLAAAKLPPYAWYDALWGVESGPRGMRRMHELADVMAIERYNLTRLIDRLESEGLVERHRSDSDGRGAVAAITDKGRALRKQMWQIYEKAVDELFLTQFDDAQRHLFADALERAALAARQSGGKG
ncbi:MarR family transcriptional regulator [Pseudomonas syringae pv. tagetis]|uniref:MarR family transcriptional regulator n=3 Tax=Pseudomonas syringae group TaxID=136849 RepID=A0A0Q0GTB7_9PSED|nr:MULTISPECIES: MarR family transcriptional regulator [Pseudomonas syringae group]KPX48864.1 MarR family transcriptional regulator [Pseudomonas syringae pv. helianthi]KPY80230.1 MarR family transcriptional regulator [Pseudomonas syringae pv. tagetis]RMR00654.1 MarR family transcriptional regulator [Pseudomonas syringae pv. helianthi]RMV49850.1 MarR family transcriptional regulator [Pseudomonas syringae pv. helianthi]RMV72487.1 MarR family transcriptional regulator [Pseudomonas caricapapayae]